MAPFPISAHQTGRSGLPHPAFRLATPQSTRRAAGFIDLDSITLNFPNTLSDGNRQMPHPTQ